MKHEKVIDFDDIRERLGFIAKLGGLHGKWKFGAEPYRPRRSLKANARYWAAVVPTFQAFMWSHGQYFEPAEVHEFFLQKFASRPVVDPATGEVLAVIGRRSSKMNTEQFSKFVNDVAGWMLEKHGLPVPEPEYMEAPPEPRRAKRIASHALARG